MAADGAAREAGAVEDCNGDNFAALVDVVGDEQFEKSKTIDFAPELPRKAAGELLAALERLRDWCSGVTAVGKEVGAFFGFESVQGGEEAAAAGRRRCALWPCAGSP